VQVRGSSALRAVDFAQRFTRPSSYRVVEPLDLPIGQDATCEAIRVLDRRVCELKQNRSLAVTRSDPTSDFKKMRRERWSNC